jgi:hypothetical protein
MVSAQLKLSPRRHRDTEKTILDFLFLRVSVVDFDFMPIVILRIDVSGTVADEAWREIQQFDQIQSADFGPQFGSGGLSASPLAPAVPPSEARPKPYPKGAWIGAEIKLLTPLLAQYAISHYLEQERVLDADVVD